MLKKIDIVNTLNSYKEINKKIKKQKLDKIYGRLEIHPNRQKTSYYHVSINSKNEIIRKYIPKSDFHLAKHLAQQSYNKKILSLTDKRIKTLETLVKKYSENEIDNVYNSLGSQRQKLITPVQKTWKQKLENWINSSYQKSTFPYNSIEIYTKNKERVRSKTEKILADLFYDLNIPYKYECPLTLKSGITVYPDFTFLSPKTHKEIYWEHHGIMDNQNYMATSFNKIKSYEQNGIFRGENLIITYEASNYGLDYDWVRILIKKYLL